jgi:hypothetical protein
MENTKCAFCVGEGKCFILGDCEDDYTCKFRKTEEQLKKSREDAEEMLRNKGLKRVTKTDHNGREYISTAPLEGGGK